MSDSVRWRHLSNTARTARPIIYANETGTLQPRSGNTIKTKRCAASGAWKWCRGCVANVGSYGGQCSLADIHRRGSRCPVVWSAASRRECLNGARSDFMRPDGAVQASGSERVDADWRRDTDRAAAAAAALRGATRSQR